ncbi:MAG TPA: alpha/beta hydrolase [Panacibacter sp.]|nr:alpha/beta hydrolase [Panacibacter sp.]
MKRQIFLFLVALIFISNVHAQKVIPLYPGKAPGSENWTWKEQNLGGYIKDITEPSLTAYVPENPNGIAVIIAPGGGFHYLVYDIEGTSIAKSLNEKGITAFVLKYRLVHEDSAHPYFDKIMQTRNFKMLDSVSAPVIKLELQDALTAVKYVRQHAAEYKIDPDKIGFEGSSAGGTITMSVIYNATDENRPNFIAPVYAYGNAVIGSQVPSVRTPAFICAASDDEMGLAPYSVEIYSKWLDAKQPVELHIYEKGGHGFGTKKQNLPVDNWLDRFKDWIFMNYPINK